MSLPPARDGGGECNQARLPKILCQRFFGKGAADTAVAILKGMNADKIKMCDSGAE